MFVAVGYTLGAVVLVGKTYVGAFDVGVTDGRMITVSVSVGVSVPVRISTIENSSVRITSTEGRRAAVGRAVGVRVANTGRKGVGDGGRKAYTSSIAAPRGAAGMAPAVIEHPNANPAARATISIRVFVRAAMPSSRDRCGAVIPAIES